MAKSSLHPVEVASKNASREMDGGGGVEVGDRFLGGMREFENLNRMHMQDQDDGGLVSVC